MVIAGYAEVLVCQIGENCTFRNPLITSKSSETTPLLEFVHNFVSNVEHYVKIAGVLLGLSEACQYIFNTSGNNKDFWLRFIEALKILSSFLGIVYFLLRFKL